MNLKGKKILVVGLARTGEAVCRFLLSQGARIKVSEKRGPEELGQKMALWSEKGVVVEAGKHEQKSFLDADIIIPSPGVPLIPELQKAKSQGVKILSEIELAYNFLKGKIVGITGSNGKSTTASLTHKILLEGGVPSYLAGNIGTPLISFVRDSKDYDVYVTEISSFQLKHAEHFRAYVSVLLNVSPDHLDWHPSFSDYYESKKKLICSQRENEVAILNHDDPRVWGLHTKTKSRVYGFSRRIKVSPGCYLEGGWVVLDNQEEKKLMKTTEIPLLGIHNQENIMAAALIGHLFSLSLPRIKESIKTFEGLEHRLEKVTTVNGVDFYNDSKATNVDATIKSIQSFKQKIVLIAGGREKGEDYHKLRRSIQERAKLVILIGEATDKLRDAWKDTVPLIEASSLEEATQAGFSKAGPGEVVLLAPACTSFDMFQNFEERGRVFKQQVLKLKSSQERKRS